MLTVIIPSFHSEKLIKERILEINNKFKIIIIENSRNYQLKKELELKYNNIEVIIPETNLGWGKAANLGIRNSKTNYIFLTQPDVKIIDNCLEKLIVLVKKFSDFTIITPFDIGNLNYVNYEVYKNYKENKKIKKLFLQEVDFVDLTWLINKKNFDDKDLWDENIFLYFEAMDFAKRLKNRNKKIFVAKNINTFHYGSSSHDSTLNHYALLTRGWHYNWSRFYFFKKHFGTYFALKKNLNIFFKILKKIIFSTIFFKKQDLAYSIAELKGLINSIFNKPSNYRPYKKINN